MRVPTVLILGLVLTGCGTLYDAPPERPIKPASKMSSEELCREALRLSDDPFLDPDTRDAVTERMRIRGCRIPMAAWPHSASVTASVVPPTPPSLPKVRGVWSSNFTIEAAPSFWDYLKRGSSPRGRGKGIWSIAQESDAARAPQAYSQARQTTITGSNGARDEFFWASPKTSDPVVFDLILGLPAKRPWPSCSASRQNLLDLKIFSCPCRSLHFL